MLISPEPLYRRDELQAAFHLRYTWSAWANRCDFPDDVDQVIAQVKPDWESDGIRLLEHEATPKMVQATFSVQPHVSPVFFTQRTKGRLQHSLRKRGWGGDFSRKVAFRSIGSNKTSDVLRYLAGQVDARQFVDPGFASFLSQFTTRDGTVKLEQPTSTQHGRYWYNLHLVLVVETPLLFRDEGSLRIISNSCTKIASAKGFGLASKSLMPDHLHLALRGNISTSPEDIALAFLNNTAYALGQNRLWRNGFYAGTFSEYDMKAVRP